MATVLVPVDFSPVSLAVADVASGIAKAMNSKATLLHVLPRNYEAEESGEPLDQHALGRLNVKDRRALELLAEHMNAAGCRVDLQLAEGNTVPTILAKAEALDVDLIVIGSHGHTSLYDLLVGSVSEGVLRQSKWPVLVVPSPGVEKHRRDTNTVESQAEPF